MVQYLGQAEKSAQGDWLVRVDSLGKRQLPLPGLLQRDSSKI